MYSVGLHRQGIVRPLREPAVQRLLHEHAERIYFIKKNNTYLYMEECPVKAETYITGMGGLLTDFDKMVIRRFNQD